MRQTSSITGRTYNPENSTIILNVAQAAAYIDNGAVLLDIFIGRDRKMCFVFPRSQEIKTMFDKWVKHEL